MTGLIQRSSQLNIQLQIQHFILTFSLIQFHFCRWVQESHQNIFWIQHPESFAASQTNIPYPELSSESKLCPNSFLKLGRNFHERRHYSISWSVGHACFTSAIHDFASDLVHPETNLVIWIFLSQYSCYLFTVLALLKVVTHKAIWAVHSAEGFKDNDLAGRTLACRFFVSLMAHFLD